MQWYTRRCAAQLTELVVRGAAVAALRTLVTLCANGTPPPLPLVPLPLVLLLARAALWCW